MTAADVTAVRDALPLLGEVFKARLATIPATTLPGGVLWRPTEYELSQARRYPCAIGQPQSAGKPLPFVGSPAGWEGLLVVRVLAGDQDKADSVAGLCVTALTGTFAHAGYTGWDVTIRLDRPVLLARPTGNSTATAGHQYTVEIYRR